MLHSLSIQNYAIIDQIQIDFSSGFHILTGETGAGKSIILGAFSLILGNRADTTVLRNEEKKCVVEARFSEVPESLKPIFQEEGLDWDPEETFIRREILPSGKSRAFVNDSPVTLQVIKDIGRNLVDLHRQHDNQSISDKEFQYTLITALGGGKKEYLAYQEKYKELKKQSAELKKLKAQLEKSQQELEFWKFNLDELVALNLSIPTELEDLEEQQQALSNADNIRETCSTIQHLVENSDSGLENGLQQIQSELQKASKYIQGADQLSERVNSLQIELEDILAEITQIQDQIEADPSELSRIDDRIGALRRALIKHQQIDLIGLMQFRDELEQKVNQVEFADEHIQKKEAEIESITSDLFEINSALFIAREKGKQKLEQHLSEKLQFVGMENAEFEVQISETEEFEEYGKHTIQFVFSPNPGQGKKPLHQVGSGGELSRLMVCIKHAVAGAMELPTLFFDEVDTGISGEVAGKVGSLIKEMANDHQIISITHLPQMASKGNAHSFIYKEVESGETFTRIKQLQEGERITEIAKMLSGDQPTEGAIQNAKELLGVA